MKKTDIIPLPHWNTRQVVYATLFVVAVGMGFWLLFRFRVVILLLFTAIILGMALHPLLDWFTRRGISRNFGLALVYILLIAIIAGLIVMLVPMIVEQSSALIVTLPEIYSDLRAALLKSPSTILLNIALRTPSDLRLVMSNVSTQPADFSAVETVFKLTGSLFNGFLALIAVFLLTSFWILESDRTLMTLILFLPQRYRVEAESLFNQIEKRVGAFVRGQFLLSLSIAILAFISYTIIGLPNTLVLALVAGIFEAVPIFGPALGAIPAVLVAYSLDPSLVIWVVVSTLVMQGLENYLLVPRIMSASVGVNPLITLLLLATFSSLLGLPGALLAIPSAAILHLLLYRFVINRERPAWEPGEGRGVNSALRYEIRELINDVRKQLRRKKTKVNSESDQVEDEIEEIAIALEHLLKNGEEVAIHD